MIYSVKLGRFYYRHYITKNNLDLYRLEGLVAVSVQTLCYSGQSVVWLVWRHHGRFRGHVLWPDTLTIVMSLHNCSWSLPIWLGGLLIAPEKSSLILRSYLDSSRRNWSRHLLAGSRLSLLVWRGRNCSRGLVTSLEGILLVHSHLYCTRGLGILKYWNIMFWLKKARHIV